MSHRFMDRTQSHMGEAKADVRFPPSPDIAGSATVGQHRRMHLWPLLLGILGLFVVGRALIIGSASVDGEGLRRDEEPMFYWPIVAAAVLITGFLLYRAIAS